MTRTPARSIDDDLLVFVISCLALLTLIGALVRCAAELSILVTTGHTLSHASGSVLDTGPRLAAHLTHPAQAFAPADQGHLPSGAWLYLIAAAIAAPVAALALRAWPSASGLFRVNGRGSGSRWARSGELRRLHVGTATQSRLVLGRDRHTLIGTEHHHSVIVFGPTGSGKTSSFVIPALLEHDGPVVALSVKTDLVRDTLAARRATGGPVHIYDPLAITGHQSAHWTPLRACRSWAEAQRMAEALTSALGDSGLADSRFWDTMAAKMLEALLHAAALEDLTMRDVVRWVDTREQRDVATILEHYGADAALQSWTASMTRDPRTLSSVYASTEVMLRAYASAGMTDARIADSLDPDELIAKGGTLYVCAPAEDQARLRPIFAALVKDIYRAAVLRAERDGPLEPSLLLVLDEAANIAPVHDLAEIAATCRSYGIQLITVFQDLAQVTARYRTKAHTVVNNHTAKVLLPGASDRDLLELLTRLLGEEQVQETTHSRSDQGTSTSRATRYRPLAAMNELRQLPAGSALLLYGNLPPVRMTLRPWYRERALRDRAHSEAA